MADDGRSGTGTPSCVLISWSIFGATPQGWHCMRATRERCILLGGVRKCGSSVCRVPDAGPPPERAASSGVQGSVALWVSTGTSAITVAIGGTPDITE